MHNEHYISHGSAFTSFDTGRALVFEGSWKDEYINILSQPSISGLTWVFGSKPKENIEFLEKLQKVGLKSVVIRETSVKDLTPLSLLPNLEMIMIEALYTSCPDFSEFPNLKYLLLNYRASAKSMFECQNLEYLHVEGYPHTDFSAISHMSKLRNLVIRGGKLTSLKGIENLKSLEQLDIYKLNKLENLEGIEHLPNLSDIRITSCKQITPDTPFADRVKFDTP